ncbi:MAG: hypothetical protein JXO72_03790, partial [Vicinamibacteria bacterium]|nr:hypothetical protein [Vicinamibacteria bacterium]
MRRFAIACMVLAVLCVTAFSLMPRLNAQQTPIIVDHLSTRIGDIPVAAVINAKDTLHIAYGHTSHGSQLTSGMWDLVDFINDHPDYGAHPVHGSDYTNLFLFNNGDTGGDALDLREGVMAGDVGYYPQWVNETLSYLGDPDPITGRGVNHPEINVIIWSWCGQASGRTEQSMIDTYLAPMSQLETEYPGVRFVYMTGHLDGSGSSGNLHQRNQQIRDYCLANGKILYDFADIESYDPDGLVNYMPLSANDNCDYDSDGNGSRESNWALAWQGSHTEGIDWYSCSAAHSQALNGNLKAYAAWHLWARLAGWDGTGSPTPTPTPTP